MTTCFALATGTVFLETLSYIGTASVADWIYDDWSLNNQVWGLPFHFSLLVAESHTRAGLESRGACVHRKCRALPFWAMRAR